MCHLTSNENLSPYLKRTTMNKDLYSRKSLLYILQLGIQEIWRRKETNSPLYGITHITLHSGKEYGSPEK